MNYGTFRACECLTKKCGGDEDCVGSRCAKCVCYEVEAEHKRDASNRRTAGDADHFYDRRASEAFAIFDEGRRQAVLRNRHTE